MASRDLVGRPLVPFFDSDDNVNDSLQLAEGDEEREEMDVDARVWDKELGYFVYPSEHQGTVSKPGVIANRESRTDSGSKLLLTPSMMLSSSAPEHFNSMAANGNPVQASTDDAPARSSSVKRGSKQKSPGRRRKDKEGGDDASAANTSSLKKGKNKGDNSNGNNNQQPRNGKQKEQLSASGKWAWSAFQSSPDPTELPMPPFLTKQGISNGNSSSSMAKAPAPAPPLPPPTPPPSQHASVQIAPPLPPGPPPSQPPQPTAPPEVTASAQVPIELSMTQDLRRMLNIGGG